MPCGVGYRLHLIVAPFAGAWIEILGLTLEKFGDRVAPFAGAWIEIFSRWRQDVHDLPSLPSRERGLKSSGTCTSRPVPASLPSRERGLKCSGTIWIGYPDPVAPFAGAWIEITHRATTTPPCLVAPFAGAWIEIPEMLNRCATGLCRSLRGSVD